MAAAGVIQKLALQPENLGIIAQAAGNRSPFAVSRSADHITCWYTSIAANAQSFQHLSIVIVVNFVEGHNL